MKTEKKKTSALHEKAGISPPEIISSNAVEQIVLLFAIQSIGAGKQKSK